MSFALFLFLLLVITGAVWGLELAFLRHRRPASAKQPWWVEYSVSFFPVILIVFLLRSFLVEPFKIPSSSMVPTLLVGDFILVNKFTYGIRLPVINRKVVPLERAAARRRHGVPLPRGPVARLHQARGRRAGRPHRVPQQAPQRERQPVPLRQVDDYLSKERMQFSRRFVETVNSAEHQILIEEDAPGVRGAGARVSASPAIATTI